ncbi:MAG: hypothetical protein Q7T61_01080 [Caulobacter sp.]|nr:hypothetical protein [Caulobacter sp.]
MSITGDDFLPLRRQLFRPSIGEALADLARQKFPRDTAKHLAKAWDIDPSTAANVVKGKGGAHVLAKAIDAHGWGLLKPLGHALTGETAEEYDERMLQQIIERAADASQKLVQLRARREALASQSHDLEQARSRSVPDQSRDRTG